MASQSASGDWLLRFAASAGRACGQAVFFVLGIEALHSAGLGVRCDARLIAASWMRRLAKSRTILNGRCRMHGGTNPGAPKGNKHAFKHGRYTAEAIAGRREVAALIRAMRALANEEASWGSARPINTKPRD
jgi:hypothetical protein